MTIFILLRDPNCREHNTAVDWTEDMGKSPFIGPIEIYRQFWKIIPLNDGGPEMNFIISIVLVEKEHTKM